MFANNMRDNTMSETVIFKIFCSLKALTHKHKKVPWESFPGFYCSHLQILLVVKSQYLFSGLQESFDSAYW